MRRFLFALAVPLLAAVACTSTQLDLAHEGQLCDEDEQCALPLICACVQHQSTDDDGADQVIAHGHCAKVGTKCLGDAGPDGAGADTAATPVDSGSATDAGDDVVDAGDTNDANDASANDADDAATDASANDADGATDSATTDASTGG